MYRDVIAHTSLEDADCAHCSVSVLPFGRGEDGLGE